MQKSAAFFKQCLADGHSIYGSLSLYQAGEWSVQVTDMSHFVGVNTGFGGSADTRTNKTVELQDTLIGFLNCGVVTNPISARTIADNAVPLPDTWVRASMLIRANSLARGHSGVRPAVVTGIVDLLNMDITPIIPLRGSISASGDLIPLSYIAGALQGKRGIEVWANVHTPAVGSQVFGAAYHASLQGADKDLTTLESQADTSQSGKCPRRHMGAREALVSHNLTPLELQPKEGLSLVNGTAVSAGAGALAIHDAQNIALLAQVLTAMSVEAFTGTVESFDPFISRVRPHAGQTEAATNIRCFLKDSRLAQQTMKDETHDQGGLRQDRYSLRTTSQWIGPQLENLTLAYQQVKTECNSTTDNPLLDIKNGRVLHGGNFQALAVTSAMEKVRQSIQQFGRMLFIQCSELINPNFNNGLPPNLEAGEPSQGFLAKGIDISVASLCSELGYLANPVTPHVQTAEMGNQSLNSLAFVSARYTHSAIDVITQLAAAHVFVVCQALDLRCIRRKFYLSLQPWLHATTRTIFDKHMQGASLSGLQKRIWSQFCLELDRTASQDSSERFNNIFSALQTEFFSTPGLEITVDLVASIKQWTSNAAAKALVIHERCLHEYTSRPSAQKYLGRASHRIWHYVRHELQVPFHAGKNGFWSASHENDDASVGEMVTKIYVAIKEGGLIGVVMDCVRDAHATADKKQAKL